MTKDKAHKTGAHKGSRLPSTLRNAEGLLAAIVESSDDAIISKDLDGTITSWNAGAERIFGYTDEEAIGRPVTMLIPENRHDEEPGIVARIKRGEKVDHYETVRRRKDGSLVNVSLSVSPVLDERGNVIGASKIARDITNHRTTKLEIEKLAAIILSSSDAIITKDLNGTITSWNPGAEKVFGYTADEAIGKPVTILMPPERVNEEPGILARIRRGEAVDHYETVRRRKDGRLIDISLNVSPLRDSTGTIVGASKIARDITEHKRLVTAVREAEMMHRLVETQEAERHRIARDLHDHIGQQMTGVRLKVERLASLVGGNDEALQELNEVRAMMAKMDKDVGFLSWELRPTELGLLGLSDALKSFTKEWSRQYDIETEFYAAPDRSGQRLDPALETSLYRIVQEALNNVLKHAEATRVRVLYHRSNTGVSLMIEDDGKGFHTDVVLNGPGSKRGLGVSGMKERAELLGGILEIESVVGTGTTVVCRIPVQSSASGKDRSRGFA